MPFTRIPWRNAFLAIGGAIGGLGLRVFAMKSRDTDAMQPSLDIIECGKDAEFDIVFVHGLNPKGTANHARDTWTAELNGQKVFWPKELLPTSTPNVRVMLLAYNSNIAWNASIAGVREHATTVMNLLILKREESPNRPIIFICHSLGGLVVKQALLLEDPKFQEAINSTRGLVFFATPHRGATGNAAQIGFICADIVRTIQQEGKNTLPELLQKDSPLVDALARSFEEKLNQFHIISVYETRAMKPHGIIVGKTSAVLDLPQFETQIDIDRDHSTICKFPSTENWGYQQFIGYLVRMMQSITSTEEKTRKDQALKKLKDNPPRDDTQFLLQAEQLAAWYAEHKQYEVSAELNERILERCDKNPDLGTNNASAVRAAYNRAFALQQLDLYSDSEQMYRLAITGRQARTGNEDDPSVLNARMQLAEVLYLRSQFAEAERELEDVRSRSSTEDRKTVLDCQASLGFLFQRLERWEDSKSLLEPTFQEMKLQLGPTDEKTLLTQHRLAFVLQSLGHNDTSETLYRDLLQKRMQKNGAADYDTLIIMRDLAHVLQKRGDLRKAEAFCEKASSGLKKLFPAGHVDIGWTDSSLARIRRALDRLNQA